MEYSIWGTYLHSIGEDAENTKKRYMLVDHFCNDKDSADRLYQLALDGRKRGTCGSLEAYEHDNVPILKPGDLWILTDFDETRACVARTKSVKVTTYREITEEDARIEGEGDSSLEYWRRVHKEFLSEECARIGKEFSEEMPVVFEEFEIEFDEEHAR